MEDKVDEIFEQIAIKKKKPNVTIMSRNSRI